jgi:hypothetical protein
MFFRCLNKLFGEDGASRTERKKSDARDPGTVKLEQSILAKMPICTAGPDSGWFSNRR